MTGLSGGEREPGVSRETSLTHTAAVGAMAERLGLRVKQAHFRPSVLTSYRTLLCKNSNGIYGPS